MGLLGGLFNLIGTSVTNSQSRINAREDRRWQEQMYERQYQDNINLWQMNNAYNTPEAQVQRLKDAGINPYLALQNVNTGTAQSAAGAQAGSGAQANAVQPHFSGITESLVNLMRAKDERRLLKEQADNVAADSLTKRIDSITQHQRNLSDIAEKLSGRDKALAEAALTDSLRRSEEFFRSYRQQQFIDASLESFLRRASMIQSIQAFPAQKRLEFAEKIANIAESISRRKVNEKQISYIAKQIITEEARGLSQKQQNDLFEDTYKYLVDAAKHKSKGSNAFEGVGGFIRSIEDFMN